MSTAERLAADLVQASFEQAEAATRADWDSVERHDRVRAAILSALKTLVPSDSPAVRSSLASAHLASLQVEQAFRAARPAMDAALRRERVGAAAGQAYGSAGKG